MFTEVSAGPHYYVATRRPLTQLYTCLRPPASMDRVAAAGKLLYLDAEFSTSGYFTYYVILNSNTAHAKY